MKKSSTRNLILMLLCTAGGLLIGFNAGHLTNGLNAALFVLGLALLSMSASFIGLFDALWQKKKKNSKTESDKKDTEKE